MYGLTPKEAKLSVAVSIDGTLHHVEYIMEKNAGLKAYYAVINKHKGHVPFRRAQDAIDYQKRSISLNHKRMLIAKGIQP